MVMQKEPMQMLTVQDVANLLHVHVNTVRRWSDNDILKAYRITRRGDRRFQRKDIEDFLANYEEFNMNKSGYRELATAYK